MPLLAEHFQVFAVDLRGQGRSTRTPGRYTLDNMGNDLVRFIAQRHRPARDLQRPVVGRRAVGVAVGVRAAGPDPRRAATRIRRCSASETTPAVGQSIKQSIGPMFALWSKYLGDQWSIGDWEGMVAAAPRELPAHAAPRSSRRSAAARSRRRT